MLVGIANNILQYQTDLNKPGDYTVNLESNNFKNKLYQAVDTVDLDDLICPTGCLYTDTDNAWEHTTTKLVLALANHKNFRTSINSTSKAPVLTYWIKSYITILND